MGKLKSVPVKKRLTDVYLGDIDFPIFYGRPQTLDFVNKVYAQDVLLACSSVMGGTAHVQYEDAVRIVQSKLQIEWYIARGMEVPSKLYISLDRLIAEANDRPAGSATGGGKRGTLKIKDIIIAGLLQNVPEDDIIQSVHQQFPEARTGPRDLAFYRHKLRKSGDLPPPPKRERKQTSRKETKMANVKEDAQEAKAAKEPRPTRTLDVLREGREKGWEPSKIATELHKVLDGRPADQKVIKDVIILGILDGKATDDIVKEVHETFKDVPAVAPKTGAKDVAYYRTRLRKDWDLDIPTTRAPRAVKDVEEVTTEDEAEEQETKAPRQRRKKGAAAEETSEEKLDA